MKKIWIWLIIPIIVISFSACGKGNQETPNDESQEIETILDKEEQETPVEELQETQETEETQSNEIQESEKAPDKEIKENPDKKSQDTAKKETQVNEKDDAKKTFRIPDFNSVDLNGNEISNDFFANNNLTLVNVWTTTCPSCLKEIPTLQEIEENYKDKGVRVLGILADGEVEKGKAYMGQKDAKYINILPTKSLITGFLDGIMYVPTTLFVDSTGAMIGEMMVGAKSTKEFSKLIDDILE